MGDRVFPNQEEYFGYNSDYTGFIPIDSRNPNDGYLWNNHEYVSYPITATVPGFTSDSDLIGFPTTYSLVIGRNLHDWYSATLVPRLRLGTKSTNRLPNLSCLTQLSSLHTKY
ncbi:DUF839 domain-containing protein [Scytonema sp. UIC 10036]|nr:DUF839 domain-containing protein [Scytonema sp. UIC 10036]